MIEKMEKTDVIIEQVKAGIKQQEMLISRENQETEKGKKNIKLYQSKIAELEYRIKELEEKKKGVSILVPQYGDGKYASNDYKESFDMLRVWYYNHFHQDPSFSPVPKWKMMFYDPTLWIPVNTYLIKGKISFQLMLTGNYPNHEPDNKKSISIELPFDILSKKENEEYLDYMLELIKIYSGDTVNLVLGDGISSRGMISFISDQNFSMYSVRDFNYYDFFDRLCDNNVHNIIYIGDSMKKEVKPETINKVQREIVDVHKRIIASKATSLEELEQSNERIIKRILSINGHI